MILSLEAPRLVDVYACDDRVTSSRLTTARGDFLEEVIERDQCCIASGIKKTVCDACHILPYSKGDEVDLFNILCTQCLPLDQYIEIVTRVRGGDEATIRDRNDIRNGMLLYTGLHRVFGLGELVVLKVRFTNYFLSCTIDLLLICRHLTLS